MKTETVRKYLNDPDTAARALGKATALTLQDIRGSITKVRPTLINNILKSAISVEGLDETGMVQMDYLDFLCLINNIDGNSSYSGANCSDEDELSRAYLAHEKYLQHVDLLCHLLRILEKEVLPFQILLNVPYKNLCHALENHRNTGEVTACGVDLIRQLHTIGWMDRADDNLTLGEIMAFWHHPFNNRFFALCRSGEITDRWSDMRELLGQILIEPSRIAYPERFHIEDVRAKFSTDRKKGKQAFT